MKKKSFSHLIVVAIAICVTLLFNSFTYSKKVQVHLKEGKVWFGIPNNTDNVWSRDNILFAGVTIYLNDGQKFLLVQSLMHAEIGKGQVAHLDLPFTDEEKKLITPDNIQKIYVEISCRPGEAKNFDRNYVCTYRMETVLYFDNQSIIATGYPIRAEKMGESAIPQKRTVEKKDFETNPKNLLHEPVI